MSSVDIRQTAAGHRLFGLLGGLTEAGGQSRHGVSGEQSQCYRNQLPFKSAGIASSVEEDYIAATAEARQRIVKQ